MIFVVLVIAVAAVHSLALPLSKAYVTLATNSEYFLAALVLQHTLKNNGAMYPLIVMTTNSAAIPQRMRNILTSNGGFLVEVGSTIIFHQHRWLKCLHMVTNRWKDGKCQKKLNGM